MGLNARQSDVRPTTKFGLSWDAAHCRTQPAQTDPGHHRRWLAPRTRMRVSVSRALPAGWYSPAVVTHCVGPGRDAVPRQHWLADLENWRVPRQKTGFLSWGPTTDFCRGIESADTEERIHVLNVFSNGSQSENKGFRMWSSRLCFSPVSPVISRKQHPVRAINKTTNKA